MVQGHLYKNVREHLSGAMCVVKVCSWIALSLSWASIHGNVCRYNIFQAYNVLVIWNHQCSSNEFKENSRKNILCNSWTKYMRIENLKLLVRIWFWYYFSVYVLYGTSAYVCKKFQWAFVGFLAKNGLCTLLLRLRLLGSSSLALNAQKDFCSLEAPDNRDTCVRIGLCVPFSFRILYPVNFI